MRIKITASESIAVAHNRNSKDWETEIDVTALTDCQRDTLSKILGMYDSARLALIDTAGNITAASIQSYIDAEEKKRLDDIVEARERVKKCIDDCAGDDYVSEVDYYVKKLAAEPDYQEIKTAYDNARSAWEPRYKAAKKHRADEETRKIQEKWVAEKAEEERKKVAADAADAPKKAQLTEAVNRLGTETQKARWAAGVMARNEVIDMILRETFAPLGDAALPADEYHLPEETDEYGQDIDRSESDKKTLTDSQFEKAQAALALIPGAIVTYHHQYYEDHDEMDTCDVARLTKTVGEYTLSADIIL